MNAVMPAPPRNAADNRGDQDECRDPAAGSAADGGSGQRSFLPAVGSPVLAPTTTTTARILAGWIVQR